MATSDTPKLTSNPLNPDNFIVDFDLGIHGERKHLRKFSHAVTTISMPSITGGSIQTDYQGQHAYYPSEGVTYSDLSMTFLAMENLAAYTDITAWLKTNAVGHPSKYLFADISIVLNDAHNTPNINILFTGAFPTEIGSMEMVGNNTAINYASFTCTFRYDEMFIKPIKHIDK